MQKDKPIIAVLKAGSKKGIKSKETSIILVKDGQLTSFRRTNSFMVWTC